MTNLKRLLLLSVLAVCVLGTTAVFAAEPAAVAGTETTLQKDIQKDIDFGALFTPEPVNLSCTATSQCGPTGGTPTSCNGSSTCSSPGLWVICDGNLTYCGCTPSGVPDCYNPTGFCTCWNQNHNFLSCRAGYCVEP